MQSSSRIIKASNVTNNAVISSPVMDLVKKTYTKGPEGEINIEEVYQSIIDQAQTKAMELINDAKAQGQEIINQSKSSAQDISQKAKEEGFNQGYSQGYKEGYSFGVNEAKEEAQAIRKDAYHHLESCHQEAAAYIKRTEKDILNLALEMARQVINAEMTINSDVILSIAQKVVLKAVDKKQIIIRVHPDNLNEVKSKKDDLSIYAQDPCNIFVVADPSINLGGVRAETPSGFIDGDIEMQLGVLIKNLLGE